MYALLIVMALINKLFFSMNMDYFKIPQIISMTGFIVVIVGISVMTLIVTIQRFNKNLLTDEGYLSFTLPVNAHSHIDAKMIVSFVWTILSLLVSAVAILVLAGDQNTMEHMSRFFFTELPEGIRQVGSGFYVILLEGILFLIIATLGSITEIYAAITIGNMSSKHRLLAGVGAYVGFGIVQQIIASIIMTAYAPGMEKYFESLSRASAAQAVGAVELVLLILLLYTLFFGVLFYFLTNWMLQKKLNLE